MNPRPHGIPGESGSGKNKLGSIFSRKNMAKQLKNKNKERGKGDK